MKKTAKPSHVRLVTATAVVEKQPWSKERVLAEARKRTAEMKLEDEPAHAIQRALAVLLVEASWSEEQFIDALCADIIFRRRQTDLRLS